jgi:hypothetical protein
MREMSGTEMGEGDEREGKRTPGLEVPFQFEVEVAELREHLQEMGFACCDAFSRLRLQLAQHARDCKETSIAMRIGEGSTN